LNRKIRSLIIDDETLAREALKTLLSSDSEIEIVAEARNGREAVQIIRKQSPDLVFLDIQMPEMDGFQVIEEIGVNLMPTTIFVTAYDKHALRAFDAHALDYLLKPFDHDRFNTALERAKSFIRGQKIGALSESLFAVMQNVRPETHESHSAGSQNSRKEAIDKVVVKSGQRIYFLKVEDIEWIEAAGDYLTLHGAGGTHLIRETMGDFYAKLDAKKFLRIHRSAIVNIERIKDLQPLFKGEYVFTLISGKRLKSSRGYRREFQFLLDEAR
jgi:two-component system, LytTR family, response regulator